MTKQTLPPEGHQLLQIAKKVLKDAKSAYLSDLGWKEVPSDGAGTCWQAPTRFQETPLYFALDDAYALETTGEGIHAYAGKVLQGELLRAEDQRCMDEAEEKRFAETGVRLGVYPNY